MRHSFGVREILVVVILAFWICSYSAAQSTSATEQQDYQAAVAKPRGSERVSALERFASAYPQSPLKIDALELLVWDARASAKLADLEYWTGQLLSVSPNNPLAAAEIIGDGLNISSENRVSYAKRTLPAVDRFDRPEGMSHEEFAAMKNFVTGTLNGVIGYSYYEQKDFTAARPYLRKAVEINPRNAQYTYTLALCDLQSANPDQAEGYTMLARAVNLTKGSPAGDRLATFARQNFQQAGGSSENWDKYLAAAVVPPPLPTEPIAQPTVNASASTPAAPASASPSTSSATASAEAPATSPRTPASSAPPTTPAATTSGGGGIGTAASTSAPVSARSATATRPVAPPHEPILTASNRPSPALPNGTPNPAATAGSPSSPPPPAATPAPAPAPAPEATRPLRVFPPRPPKHIAPGSPVSVGVLIQASLATPANRKPVVFTLSDLVRHLREKDEAFIMSFSRGVVFQEDLTSNSKSLETAMDDIAPTPGAAMYDAVTFAAGHLDRVARNPNRILLVIAAEGDRDSTVSPLELSSEINLSGVTIYCIGVGVATPADQNRLEALADSTGGRAIFISDLSRFRDATRDIAQGLGISFQ